jgi:hypothetical protein
MDLSSDAGLAVIRRVRGGEDLDAPNLADGGQCPRRPPLRTGTDAPARNGFFNANSADYSTRYADVAYWLLIR